MSTPTEPVRVAIVNDYAIVVAGVAAVLAPYADRVVVVDPYRGDPDLLLYDSFGQLQGTALRIEARLAASSPARLVVYSWNLDHALVRHSLAAGAGGYLFKGLPADELVTALEALRDGEAVVPTSLGPKRSPLAADWPGRAAGLSVREAEIVALITQGLTNVEIAAQSFLSINSVKTYIRTAYRKMGVQRRPQAVLWGMQHGFAPPAPFDAG